MKVKHSSDINDIPCPKCDLRELYLGEPLVLLFD